METLVIISLVLFTNAVSSKYVEVYVKKQYQSDQRVDTIFWHKNLCLLLGWIKDI